MKVQSPSNKIHRYTQFADARRRLDQHSPRRRISMAARVFAAYNEGDYSNSNMACPTFA